MLIMITRTRVISITTSMAPPVVPLLLLSMVAPPPKQPASTSVRCGFWGPHRGRNIVLFCEAIE
jgi:hypothetical protein